MDLRYVDCDEDGIPQEEKVPAWKRKPVQHQELLDQVLEVYAEHPKYRAPKALNAANLVKLWGKFCKMVDSTRHPLPAGWFESQLEWVRGVFKDGGFIPLVSLLYRLVDVTKIEEYKAKKVVEEKRSGLLQSEDVEASYASEDGRRQY